MGRNAQSKGKKVHYDDQIIPSGVRFSGHPVAIAAKKWLQVTEIFDYSGPHGYSKYFTELQ